MRSMGSYQPDETSMARVKQRHAIPFDMVQQFVNHKEIPPQCRLVPYVLNEADPGIPNLLIPANPNRMGFIIGVLSATSEGGVGNTYFSYGPPIRDINGGFIGIPLSSDIDATAPTIFQESNGTVSIDDIYVFLDQFGITAAFLAYEILLTIEGKFNKRGFGRVLT